MPKLGRTRSLILLWGCLFVLIHSPFGLTQTLRRPEPNTRFGGIYRRALANNPATLDPAFVNDIYSRAVVTQIFEGLVQFDAHLNPTPAIAKYWEASRDGRIWTFTLRRGVQFHHGREVTAQDFVYSYQILLIRMCLGTLRPPMEICLGPNHRRCRLQSETALRLHGLQFV
jgi:ABC-type transport system substrate-binding protein